MRSRSFAQTPRFPRTRLRLSPMLCALGLFFANICAPTDLLNPSLHAQTDTGSAVASPNAQPPTEAQASASSEASSPLKPVLELRPQDRIVFIGSSVGRSMFQDGFLPALLRDAAAKTAPGAPSGTPTLLNITRAGESLTSGTEGGGRVAEALRQTNPDVVLAFFGSVEAAAGEPGLSAFGAALRGFLKQVKEFESTPERANRPVRLVLLGSTARERAPEVPGEDADRMDTNLKNYSEAMAAIAKEQGVPFFDLHAACAKLFETGPQRSALLPKRWGATQSALTWNGGLLTEEANRLLAPVICQALLGTPVAELPASTAAVPVGETGKRYVRGETSQSDENKPPFNVTREFSASLFASEAQFPPLVSPVQMELDSKGRLWVLCALENNSARLLMLEDINADGIADRCTVFADQLADVSSFVLYRDGILLNQGGDLWLLRDPAGSGRPTEKRRLLSGLSVPKAAGPQGANSAKADASRRWMVVDPKGGVLLHDAPHPGGVETGLGPTGARGGVFRFEPATGYLEVIADPVGRDGTNPANPDWNGSVLDDSGRDLFRAAGGSWQKLWKASPRGITSALVAGTSEPSKTGSQRVLVGSTEAPGRLQLVRIRWQGASAEVEAAEDVVAGSGNAFYPLAQTFAADGAVLFSEGTQGRGRIYRLDTANSPVAGRPVMEGKEAPALLEYLRFLSEPGILQRARHALASMPREEVLDALRDWELTLSVKDSASESYDRLRLQALWVRRWFDGPGLEASGVLLKKLLESGDSEVRAEAVRTVRETRRVLPEAIALLEPRAKDESALVRFEVLAAAGAFAEHDPEAVKLVHTVLGMPMDAGLERMANEALQKLEPDPSRLLVPGEPKALRFVLSRLSPPELAKAPGVEPVWVEQVDRFGTEERVREAALLALAKERNTSRAAEIVRALVRAEGVGAPGLPMSELLSELLLKTKPDGLHAAEGAIENLAADSKQPSVRTKAHAAWLLAVLDEDALWKRLEKAPARQVELLDSLPYVGVPAARARLRPTLERVLRAGKGVSESVRAAALRALPLTGPEFVKQNFELLAAEILGGGLVPEAASALGQLSPKSLNALGVADLSSLGPLVPALSKWLDAVPERERRTPKFSATLQVARVLSEMLRVQAEAAAQRLREVKTEVLVVRTVFGEGRFDTPFLSVSAGQPLELEFENREGLSCNLVLLAPGVREAVLLAAGKMDSEQQDSKGRAFVPSHPGILAATKLLAPGGRELLKLKAPEKAGRYEFISTVPGSPSGLRGVLEVAAR